MKLESYIASVSFAMVGCTSPSSLTSNEQVLVDRMLDYGTIETTFVDVLSTYADETVLFDADGNSGVSAFQAGVSDARTLLDAYSSDDRIMIFDPAEMESKDDAFGFYRASLFGDGLIALNATLFARGYIDPHILYHEAGHDPFGDHDDALQVQADALRTEEDALVTEDALFSTSFAQHVIAAQDFPYLLSFFYHIADVCYEHPVDHIERVVLNYSGSVSAGTLTPQEAYDDLTLLLLQSENDWVSSVVASQYTSLPYLTLFGISDQEMQNALLLSDLFEGQQQIYNEGIDAFVASYPDEEILTLEEMGK